jgi:hypothetical protein
VRPRGPGNEDGRRPDTNQGFSHAQHPEAGCYATSYPGPLRGSEALVREAKALVNTGHVCPKILDIFVTWPY